MPESTTDLTKRIDSQLLQLSPHMRDADQLTAMLLREARHKLSHQQQAIKALAAENVRLQIERNNAVAKVILQKAHLFQAMKLIDRVLRWDDPKAATCFDAIVDDIEMALRIVNRGIMPETGGEHA